MKEVNVYSEKLKKNVKVQIGELEGDLTVDNVIIDDDSLPMVGWVHNGWNNDNGGANW